VSVLMMLRSSWNSRWNKCRVSILKTPFPGHRLILTELGNRIPIEIKDKFEAVLDESIMIPSMSHYLK
jgi:hypothetical protein